MAIIGRQIHRATGAPVFRAFVAVAAALCAWLLFVLLAP